MSEIVATKDTYCFFCGKPIKWDSEFMSCPDCSGSGDDPYNGCSCPYCGGDGFIESDEYVPCCDLCFEKEYKQREENDEQRDIEVI